MKKLLALVLIAVLCLGVLISCGGNSDLEGAKEYLDTIMKPNAEKSPAAAEAAKKNNIAAPGYMEVDLDNLKATLVRAPQLDEIPANIKIMHVIEYYAR